MRVETWRVGIGVVIVVGGREVVVCVDGRVVMGTWMLVGR